MKWLVTYKKQVGRERVLEQLRSLGCTGGSDCTEAGVDEEVLSIEGPGNLAQLAESHRDTMKIYPNSRMSLF